MPEMTSRTERAFTISVVVTAVVVDVIVATWAFSQIKPSGAWLFCVLWIGWLAHVAIVIRIVCCLRHRRRYFLAKGISFVAIAANLILIFSICPMDLPAGSGVHTLPPVNSNSAAVKFLIEENKKAVDEIKSRDEEEDNWFHNKFILVGGLLAAT